MRLTLFRLKGNLREYLEERKKEMLAEVEGIDADRFLATSEARLCEAFVESYGLEAPVLHHDRRFIHDHGEAKIDVTREPGRVVANFGGPSYRPGTRIVVAVPFAGDAELFNYRPSKSTTQVPEGQLVGSELHFTYEGTGLNADEVQRDLESSLRHVQGWLAGTAEDVAQFNQSLCRHAEQAIRRRRQLLLDERGLVERLGIPVRRREGAPTTYAVPVRRRRAAIESVPAPSEPFTPEHTLRMADYEDMLQIIHNMALVMESSPTTFGRLEEEALRDHFLVQLNGQYEGDAVGEVFNCEGKTDIFIRKEAGRVFIAECKFWDGARSLRKTIDQLLSYTTWRETKTAILLFSRRRKFSGVLSQISPVVSEHPCFKRECDISGETRFRFMLHRPDDPAREVILTVCVFNVPRAPNAD